jgi:hypothetical protein
MYIVCFRPWKFNYKVLIYEESQNFLTNSPVLPGYFFKNGVMAASLGLLRQNPEKRPSQTRQNLRSESRKVAMSRETVSTSLIIRISGCLFILLISLQEDIENARHCPSLRQCCRSGSAMIWLSWIRIRIGNADPDPGNKEIYQN